MNLEATVDGYPCRVLDLSLGGARLIAEMPTPPSIGSEVELEIGLASGPTHLRAYVRRALERGYAARMGVEFAEGQEDAITQLALALLHTNVAAEADARTAA